MWETGRSSRQLSRTLAGCHQGCNSMVPHKASVYCITHTDECELLGKLALGLIKSAASKSLSAWPHIFPPTACQRKERKLLPKVHSVQWSQKLLNFTSKETHSWWETAPRHKYDSTLIRNSWKWAYMILLTIHYILNLKKIHCDWIAKAIIYFS